MSDKADLDELARRYLDLWQDQMAALAADPEIAETMNRLVTTAGTQGAAAWAAWPAVMAGFAPAAAGGAAARDDGGPSGKHSQGSAGGPPSAPGPASLAASPGHGVLDLERLAERLAALEERLAALESATGGSGGTRRKPRKRGT